MAAQLGASVTLVDSDGMGGSAVLTDCVPSKALIAVADGARATADNADLGVLVNGVPVDRDQVGVDLAAVNERIQRLALAQSLMSPVGCRRRSATRHRLWSVGWPTYGPGERDPA